MRMMIKMETKLNIWIGKKCKIFIRNLSEQAIVYTATILSVDSPFMTILDRDKKTITININDIIQIRGAE